MGPRHPRPPTVLIPGGQRMDGDRDWCPTQSWSENMATKGNPQGRAGKRTALPPQHSSLESPCHSHIRKVRSLYIFVFVSIYLHVNCIHKHCTLLLFFFIISPIVEKLFQTKLCITIIKWLLNLWKKFKCPSRCS